VVSRRMMIDKNWFWPCPRRWVAAGEFETGSAFWRLPRGLSRGQYSPLGWGARSRLFAAVKQNRVFTVTALTLTGLIFPHRVGAVSHFLVPPADRGPSA
jgi:hypothetical protein